MIKILKEHIGFHCILIEILLYALIEYIPQEVLNKIRDKSITHNIFRIQDNESIMCRLYCIAFIEYMLAGKTLLNYTNAFSPNDYEKNDKIIYKYLSRLKMMKNVFYFILKALLNLKMFKFL